jgi:hypothetical protein
VPSAMPWEDGGLHRGQASSCSSQPGYVGHDRRRIGQLARVLAGVVIVGHDVGGGCGAEERRGQVLAAASESCGLSSSWASSATSRRVEPL